MRQVNPILLASIAFMGFHGSTPATQHQLLDGLPEYAPIALHPDGRVATWCSAAEQIFGRTADQAIGQPLEALYEPDASDESVDRLLTVAREGSATQREGWRATAGGRRFWADEVVTASRDLAGSLTGFVVVVRDASERKRLEDQLRATSATFEGILAIASDAVICIGEDQRITFYNQGAKEIFGYSPDEVLGERLEILIPPYARATHEDQVHRFGRSATTARRMGERGEITGLRKSGEVFPAEASISRLDVGTMRVYTAVLRDITERRVTEETLAQNVRELARSNEELEQFAYVASHDLQEPLRMVASYTQLLARRYKDALDEDAEEFIGFAVDGVRRMQALINDLLAYSRVGRSAVELRPTDIGRVLDRVLAGLQPSIQEADAEVTYDSLPVVEGDPSQLEQLLQNLVANAVKFRGDKTPRVHVSAEREDGQWVFSVQDNGIGIAPEFQDRIFVIFQRLHNREEYPGTGIGLSICKKIVERHGGRMWIDSTPGAGSTFYFTLPAVD